MQEPGDAPKRRKVPPGALTTLLLAAALCAAGFVLYRIGTAGSPFNAGTAPSAAKSALGGADASLYLGMLPWEKKSHDTLQSLSKMKNLRYALEFIQKYSPDQIAAIQAKPSSMEDAIANFGVEAGTMISMEAVIIQKDPVTEKIELEPEAPSTLLSLGTDGKSNNASMLVAGSALDGFKAGDAIRFSCIPLYCYVPKDGQEELFLITIPELIEKIIISGKAGIN
jgi:hypothetical protein